MIICEDYLGNIFNSEAEMCRYHGVSPQTYNYRKLHGLPLKTCLSPVPPKKVFVFHGKAYKSFRDCCVSNNVSYRKAYEKVIRKGLSPEKVIDDALNLQEKRQKL